MADAVSRSGTDGTRGEERADKGTGDPKRAYSPMATPAETEVPDRTQAERRERGERRESAPGDKASTGTTDTGRDPGFGRETGSGTKRETTREGTGRETAETDRGRDAGPDSVTGAGTGMGAGMHQPSTHDSRLLPHEESDKLTQQLHHAVANFVDEPRSAVEEADHVLEEAATRFTDAVKQRRSTLRGSWQSGGEGGKDKAAGASDTEQLRLVLRDYRELTERLLRS